MRRGKGLLFLIGLGVFFFGIILGPGLWDTTVASPARVLAEWAGQTFGTITQPTPAPGATSSPDAPVETPVAPIDPSTPLVDGGVVNVAATQAALAALPALSTSRHPDYSRAAFGATWADVNGNGCDTRNDILYRDLTSTDRPDGCTVLTGTLNDPYTGRTIQFTRGTETSSAVQIDHIFSLSAAWDAGAWQWTDSQRLAYANDPNVLLAVDGPTNNQKSDKTPAEWLPPNQAFQCTFAAKYIQIATTYHLAVDSNDRAALTGALATCPA